MQTTHIHNTAILHPWCKNCPITTQQIQKVYDCAVRLCIILSHTNASRLLHHHIWALQTVCLSNVYIQMLSTACSFNCYSVVPSSEIIRCSVSNEQVIRWSDAHVVTLYCLWWKGRWRHLISVHLKRLLSHWRLDSGLTNDKRSHTTHTHTHVCVNVYM